MTRWLDLGFGERILPFDSTAARAYAEIAASTSRRATRPRRSTACACSFPPGGGLIRASNTQPVIVARYEARTAGGSRGHPGRDRGVACPSGGSAVDGLG